METSKSSVYNDIIKSIWHKIKFLLFVKNKIWITTAHIPGARNVIADYESRKNCRVNANSCNIWKGNKAPKLEPDLDCFSSRLNTQLSKNISCKQDPYANLFGVFSVH